MIYIALIIIFGVILLMSISIDSQLSRIEKKVNMILDETWDVLDENRKDKRNGKND